MLFNTTDYAIFFGIAFLVSWATAGLWGGRVRMGFLLVASYVFYAYWDWRFLGLIILSTLVDYAIALRLEASADEAVRKRLIALSLLVNLGLLGVFKYTGFFVESAAALLDSLGVAVSLPTLRIVLPVGISFYTFQTLSYSIDVYRRELPAERSLLDFATFVAFFPQLVAGPIVRASTFLPQLASLPRLTRAEGGEGLFLIALGLVKKVVIGDQLAVNLVDRVFTSPASYSSVEVLAGIYGYAVQIYCDFSGYSDIAIGSALLLGLRFPDNFASPYKAHDLADFWRRWHISLSSWLRDYLYIPLGGNRGGPWKTYRNLLITMLLGGLWHGPAWTFVLWGLLHGLGLAVTRAFQRRRAADRAPTTWGRALAVFATFHYVCLAWVFFRAPTFGKGWEVLSQLGTATTGHGNLPPILFALLGVGLVSHYTPDRVFAAAQRGFIRLPAVAQGAILFAVAVLLHEASSTQEVPFIYFQF